jgi:hypothetical protein
MTGVISAISLTMYGMSLKIVQKPKINARLGAQGKGISKLRTISARSAQRLLMGVAIACMILNAINLSPRVVSTSRSAQSVLPGKGFSRIVTEGAVRLLIALDVIIPIVTNVINATQAII